MINSRSVIPLSRQLCDTQTAAAAAAITKKKAAEDNRNNNNNIITTTTTSTTTNYNDGAQQSSKSLLELLAMIELMVSETAAQRPSIATIVTTLKSCCRT